MPFTQGMKRPANAGRKRGSPTKRTAEVRERLAALNCDPIEGMARIALNKRVDVGIRAGMYKELAKYVAPQLRAMDHRLVDDEGKDRSFLGEIDRLMDAG